MTEPDELCTPAERERRQVEIFDRVFALSESERLRRRNTARAQAGLPPVETDTAIARIRRQNRALRRAGERPIDPRPTSRDSAL